MCFLGAYLGPHWDLFWSFSMDHSHDWLTLHKVLFSDNADGLSTPLTGPASADFWRFAPKLKIGPKGVVFNDASWGGFASYASKQDAEDVFNSPETHLPFLDNAVEAWHALVIPYAHRGVVKWRDVVQTDCAIKIASKDPKGPLVVLTSSGYDNPGRHEAQRIMTFFKAMLDVIDHYRTLSGNLRADAFAGGTLEDRDGCTLTIWQDDKAMMAAAYKSGEHKAQLDYHKTAPHFDRSSFTRGRIVASKGAWNGTDPIKEMVSSGEH